MFSARRTFVLAMALGLVAAVTVAKEPRMEWGPAGGNWKVLTGLHSAGDKVTSGSGNSVMTPGLRRSFWGEGYGVGPGNDGPLVEFSVHDQPVRTTQQCEDMYDAKTRSRYNSITCRETTFQGLPATESIGVMGGGRWIQTWMEVQVSTNPVRTLMINSELISTNDASMARSKERVAKLLSTIRLHVDAPPASVWKADIRIPRNLKPGDVLSPDVIVTDQNGKGPSEPVQVALLINGKWASSIVWDGSRTEIEAQVSVEHQAVVATMVVPKWSPGAPPPTQGPAPPPGDSPPPSTDGPAVVSPVPGLGNAGPVPGPRNIPEAIASIVGPAGLGLLGALVSGLLGGGTAPPTPPPQAPTGPPPEGPPGRKPSRSRRRTASKEPPPEAVEPSEGEPEKISAEASVTGAEEKAKEAEKKAAEAAKEKAAKEKAEKDKAEKEKKKQRRKKKPTPEQVAKTKEKADKAVKEAKKAAGIGGTIWATLSNIKKDFKEAATTIGKAGEAVGNVVAKGARQLLKDPKGTLKAVVKTTKDTVKKVANKAAELGEAAGKAGFRVAKNVYKDPLGALQKLKNGAKGLFTAVKDFVTDPSKIWSALKEFSGINNFANALDPNRSLLQRIGQVGVGVFKLYGTITTTQMVASKIKSGGTTLIKGIKKGFKRLTTKPPTRAEMRLAARKWVKDLKHRRTLGGKPGAVKSVAGPPDLSGFSPEEVKIIRNVAHKHGVNIHVRPRGALAQKLIKNGKALPKPEFVKAKTVKKLDTFLGFSDDGTGMVACKQPMMPGRRPPGMDSKTWVKLQKRCAQRAQEFRDQASKLHQLEKKGKIVWDRKTGKIFDKATGKGFTGDHDIFAYTDPNGNPVSPWVRDQINRDMMTARHPHCPGRGIIEHPEHMDWDVDKVSNVARGGSSRSPRDVARGIKQVIVDSHGIDGENLISIFPEGDPGISVWMG